MIELHDLHFLAIMQEIQNTHKTIGKYSRWEALDEIYKICRFVVIGRISRDQESRSADAADNAEEIQRRTLFVIVPLVPKFFLKLAPSVVPKSSSEGITTAKEGYYPTYDRGPPD